MNRPENSRPICTACARAIRVACGFAAFLISVSLTSAATAPAPLRLKIDSVVGRPRSLAPTAIDVLIVCDSSRLFEGQLELTFFLGKETRTRVYEYRSGDLTISAGDYRMRVMIPPLPVPREIENVVIHGRFVGKNGVIEFPDEYNAQVAGSHKRQFVLGISQPKTKLHRPDGLSFADRLPLEQFNRNPDTRTDWLTYPQQIPPEDLPATSVGYFIFDLLVLEEEGFSDLKEPQLRAIGDWVEAGGSLLVITTRAVQPRHRDFLNRLVRSQGQEAVFWRDDRGMLSVLGDDASESFVKSAPGLGRVVVIHREIKRRDFFESPAWNDIVQSLWKVRTDQHDGIRTTGVWGAKTMPMQNNYLRPPAFSPVPLTNGEKLYELLIPSRVEGIPLRTVVTILVLFLLAAAPGDYLLLGFLRRRKYTWVLFTVVSLGFTLLTVRLAQSHMGRIDYRTHLTFVDLGSDTKAVRSTKIDMIFAATERVLETPTRDEIYLSLNQRRVVSQRQLNPRYFDASFDEYPLAEDPDVPLAEGRAVGSYLIRQQMRQWSPRFQRITACAPDVTVPPIVWERQADETWETAAGRSRYYQRVSQTVPGATLLLMRHRETHVVSAQGEGTSALPADEQTLLSLIAEMSRRTDQGMFSLVSQISPNGADGFEDLSVVDPSDLTRWWIMLVVPEGLNHTVYRKSLP